MTNPFDIPSAISEDSIERIAKDIFVSSEQRISFSHQTTRTMHDIQDSLHDAQVAMREPNRDLLFRNLLKARNDIKAIIKNEEKNAQVAWQRFATHNLGCAVRNLDVMVSLFDYEIAILKLDEANATTTNDNNLTTDQIKAICLALSCYNHRINRLMESMSIDEQISEYKTQKGTPTIEAIRAKSRIENATQILDSLMSERKLLSIAFGIWE